VQTTTPPATPFQLQQATPPCKPRKLRPGDKGYQTPSEKAAAKRRQKQETVFYETPQASDHETNFRHAHWKWKRKLVRQALVETATGRNQLDAFDNCGADCTVEYCKETERYRLRATYCKNRNCEPCMKSKSNLLAANLEEMVTDLPGKQFRFITLTLKHADTPLADQLDRLTACFKKLRNHPCWKSTQDGGAVMLEVKWSPDTAEWHPHLHIVAQGFFLAQAELSAAWYAITKDSFKVDIRVIKSPRDAAHYVAKYVSKGINDDVWHNHNARQEWVLSMKGRRICATYGTWRGFKLLAHPETTDAFEPVGSLNNICRCAANNERWAITLLDTLTKELQYNPHRKREKGAKSP
jgi:hypothetical protein